MTLNIKFRVVFGVTPRRGLDFAGLPLWYVAITKKEANIRTYSEHGSPIPNSPKADGLLESGFCMHIDWGPEKENWQKGLSSRNFEAACTPSAVRWNFVGNRDYGKWGDACNELRLYVYINSTNEWKWWKSLNIVVADAFSKQLLNLPPYHYPREPGGYGNTPTSRFHIKFYSYLGRPIVRENTQRHHDVT